MKLFFPLPRWFWLAVVGITMMTAFGRSAMKSGPLAPMRVTVTQVAVGQVVTAQFVLTATSFAYSGAEHNRV